MLLKSLIEGTTVKCEVPEIDVKDIVYDSRKATEGTIFVCIKGEVTDGHKYAKSAYDLGCRIFLVEDEVNLPDDAVILVSADARHDLAQMSCNFFNHPADEMKIVGITGTKGKTTVTYIMRSALEKCGIKTGVIGTIGAFYGDKKYPTANTTPESYELQKILRMMADAGCKVVVMEVSSLGLKMSRVGGINFYAGIFTNLSPDHIGGGEHKTYEEYAYWKKQLYKQCGVTIANIDDAFFDDVKEASRGETISYGLDPKADYYADNVEYLRHKGFLGIAFDCENKKDGKWRAKLSMPGFFSVYNALSSIALLRYMDVPIEAIKEALQNVSIPGRVEIFKASDDFDIIIDYAHNGLSFESIIETMRVYKPNRIITLFGSTGSRGINRRKEMGLVSGRMSDFSIITSDDPEDEDPMKIIDEIASYVEEAGGKGKYVKIVDREEAICYALDHIEKGDILLLLGKGNEQFMKIKGEKVPFSEAECIKRYMASHKK